MKETYKNFYYTGMFVLLLISCSLTKALPVNKVMQSSSGSSKSRTSGASIYVSEVMPCTVETGYLEGRVNMRFGAGTTFGVQTVLEEGERLEILDTGDWLTVKTGDGLVGYIKSEYCMIGEKTNEKSR